MRFVLASASPARLSVLRSAGIDPLVRVSGVDEDAVTATLVDPAPQEQVTSLAEAKAEAVVPAVAAQLPDAVIVGCDSMLLVDGELVGKPGLPEIATKRWREMAGRTGELITGQQLIRLRAGSVQARQRGAVPTTVHFAEPSETELDAYVGTGEPLDVAGGFTLDGYGGWFVDRVDGDPAAVLGISLALTRKLLADVGLSVIDLWSAGPNQ